MKDAQNKPQSLSPVTDAEAVTEDTIYDRNYEPDGYVPANIARQMEIQLRTLLNLIDVHDVTCLACDIDGDEDCGCLQRQLKVAKAMLNKL